ncbi:hypothetical protein MKX01_018583, partial [Papaver californicum]
NGFRDFVTTALVLHDDTDIHTLTVLWVDHLNIDIDICDALNTWALYAVKRKVKELVFLRFNCESLTDLDLYLGSMCRSTLCLPESICLPNLKSVKFQGLHVNEVLMNKFFSSCPALESATITNCLVGDLQIVSHTLKHFALSYSSFNATVYEVANFVLLFAPNLDFFDIKCHLSQLFGFFNSLVKADVEMIVQEKRNNPYTYSELPDYFKTPDLLKTQPPQLANLRCVQLHTFLSKGCAQAIFYLLRISPKIETLSLRIDKAITRDCFAEQPTDLYCDKIIFFEDYWKPGLASPCEPLPLKVLELVDINGSVNELRFVEVFLKYAVKLEKVALYVNWDGSANLMERIMKFDEKLRSLPRASSRVSTLFYTKLFLVVHRDVTFLFIRLRF